MGTCCVQIGDDILRDYVISALELCGIRCVDEPSEGDAICCCDDNLPPIPDGSSVIVLYRRPRYTRSPAYAALSERCRCAAVERPFLLEELQRVVSELINSSDIRADAVPVKEDITHASMERTMILRREDSCAELDGSIIRFTEREFRLLELLGERAGTVVSRESILSEAWDSTESASNAVDVYIGYLRRKLEPILGKGVIVAVRGAGYQFTPGERKLLIR